MKLSDLPARTVFGRDTGNTVRRSVGHHPDTIGDKTAHLKAPLEKEVEQQRQHEEAQVKAEAEKKARVSAPIDVTNIQWVPKSGEHVKFVKCSLLEEIVRKMMFYRTSIYNPLYRTLLERLRTAPFQAVTQFRVLATGMDPMRKKALGHFLKIVAAGEEFILPASFLVDCREAFVRPRR